VNGFHFGIQIEMDDLLNAVGLMMKAPMNDVVVLQVKCNRSIRETTNYCLSSEIRKVICVNDKEHVIKALKCVNNNSRFGCAPFEIQTVAARRITRLIRQENIIVSIGWIVMHFHYAAVVCSHILQC
jgi:hypothetical protein